MAYIVRAVLDERGTGSYRGHLETRSAAIGSAKELRAAGMKTVVIGPDGMPIDETELECEPVPARTEIPSTTGAVVLVPVRRLAPLRWMSWARRLRRKMVVPEMRTHKGVSRLAR